MLQVGWRDVFFLPLTKFPNSEINESLRVDNMTTFDELALAYDNSIDWAARLSREMPFILKSIGATSNRRVLDMACGSGRHSVELAELGYTVDAFDTSSMMVDAAEELAQTRGVTISIAVDNMLRISETYQDPYDLILCLGNSLALLPSFQDIAKVIGMVSSLLSPTGVFVCQTLNFDEIAASGFSHFEPKTGNLRTGEEVVFKRRFDHSQGDATHTILVLSSAIKQHDEWSESTSHQKVLRVNRPVLLDILEESGFEHIEIYSSYAGDSFDFITSRSLIVRAMKS
jgi:2-polyprenyl-3-methyl-5-hydroxy-6-metoxy-1,4-benzoquinol methylase